MTPLDRAISAPAAAASDLRELFAQALEEHGRATLAIHEEELTALLRQSLGGSPVRGALARRAWSLHVESITLAEGKLVLMVERR